jgi:Protein of unknown function (DUF3168)
MPNPASDLKRAFLAALSDIGWPVLDTVKPNTPLPYIDIGIESMSPYDTKTSQGFETRLQLDFWSVYRGQKQVLEKMLDVYHLLHNTTALQLSDQHLILCVLSEQSVDFEATETEQYEHGIQTWRVITQHG